MLERFAWAGDAVLVKDWGEGLAVAYSLHDHSTHLVNDEAAALLQAIARYGVAEAVTSSAQEAGFALVESGLLRRLPA